MGQLVSAAQAGVPLVKTAERPAVQIKETLRALLASRERVAQLRASLVEAEETERTRVRNLVGLIGTPTATLLIDGQLVTLNAHPGRPPLVRVRKVDVIA